MHEYCEHHHIISTCQEGFMARRNTIRQLTLMTLTLQDAALTGKNIYTAYIDFSSAFNTINHDKCFQVMYDLGIPEDAIKNVRHLYSNATTCVEIPGMGTTSPIPVRQGTIQGDTLSPLMFNIYLEPLLRWLQVGGRGYAYGCLQGDNTTSIKHACASLAYADDLAIMTSNLNHMKIQATKVDQYCTWSNLKANHGKCAITGICHNDKHTGIMTHTAMENKTIKHQLEKLFKINGTYIPYLPPNKPYRNLGVQLCMNLDWSYQLQATTNKLRKSGETLARSFASQRQCIRYIETVMRPVATYAFPLAPYQACDINQLDSIMRSTVKTCCGLPNYIPSVAIHLGHDDMGMGIPSLLVDYVQYKVSALIHALQDTGRLGAVTRAMTELCVQKRGHVPMAGHYRTAWNSFIHGIKITKGTQCPY